MLPPAVTVHGLEQARAALAPGLPVLLLSGWGAASYAGAGWWRAMIAAARAGESGVEAPDALDCADQAGRALEALACGCRLLVLEPCPGFESVAGRAEGAVLLRTRPPSLDLDAHGAGRRLVPWLRGEVRAGG